MQGESGVKFLSGQLNAIVRFSGCGKSEKGIASWSQASEACSGACGTEKQKRARP